MLGRSVAGAVIGGGVGAIIGGSTASKSTTSYTSGETLHKNIITHCILI